MKKILMVFSFMIGLSPPVWAEGQGAIPSPEEIRAMSRLERTFVPDAAKEAAFRFMLEFGRPWELYPSPNSPPFCEDVMANLQAWENVEIIEPVIRSNDIFGPEFEEFHSHCPEMNLHGLQLMRRPGDEPTFFGRLPREYIDKYLTYNFRFYQSDVTELAGNFLLFYGEGWVSKENTDQNGRPPPHFDYAEPSQRRGFFQFINLPECRKIPMGGDSSGGSLSFYDEIFPFSVANALSSNNMRQETIPTFMVSDMGMVRINGNIFVISGRGYQEITPRGGILRKTAYFTIWKVMDGGGEGSLKIFRCIFVSKQSFPRGL